MPVALYNQRPPQVQAIQIASDAPTLQLIASLVGTGITSLAQLRAVLGTNSAGQPAAVGDWIVHDVGGLGFRVLTNSDFTSQYVLAT